MAMATHAAIRSLDTREGIGLTANVVQQSSLRLSQIAVERPALIVLHHGSKTLKNGPRQWRAERGDVVALAGGQTFDVLNRLSPDGLFEARWVVWDDRLFAQTAGPAVDGAPLRLATPSPAVLKQVGRGFLAAVEGAVEAIRHPHDIPATVARHRLHELLVWLAEHGVRFATRPAASVKQRLRSLLAGAPSQAWTMSDAADRFAMSEATLRRRLTDEGTNFAALLSDVRMSSAMTLLQSTERPIGHIASDVGYGSASRFSVRFRARFGFAPSAVRGHRR
jgi:AraC-like DNA-binding protein